MAKSLVSQWKKLVPQETQSDPKQEHSYERNEKSGSSTTKENKPVECKTKGSESVAKEYKETSTKDKCKLTTKDSAYSKTLEGKKSNSSLSKKHLKTAPDASLRSDSKSSIGKQSSSEKLSPGSTTSKKDSSSQKVVMKQSSKEDRKLEKSGIPIQSSTQNGSPKSTTKMVEEDFEPPTMSFESYLNYDQIANKRKKTNNPGNEKNKKTKTDKQPSTLPTKNKLNEEKSKCKPDAVPETLEKKVKVENLTDLLDIPLPKFLPDYSILPSPPYEADKGSTPEALLDEHSDMTCFTGKRLNSKMQVYSGSKPIFLSKMLTLYEQCLRVLQNNIDLLHEVGGVPFEILEPVLERCTPEQLNRIEECNPSFMEESDHLWKKHCQKDFRNEHLLEYESWREMYLRLFSEREEKLQKITKDISSAHSGKPKGRQVKLAYVHCVAKPPRSIRRRQEIFGTAGPIVQPHPVDRLKIQKIEREKLNSSSSTNSPSSSALLVSSPQPSGANQDARRPFKRVAPMMAKSMRAFKNRVGPR
ncbi:elongin-A-like isoform X2 [Pleurodeles waltl]